MKHIICLDIENTIIDDLQNCNFIEENCEKIKRLIVERRGSLLGLVFNTWGWKTNDEVDINVVNRILVKFGIDLLNIGCDCRVFTKEFSVDKAIEAGWLFKEDKERALHPGMMQEFGISKISCFFEMCRKANVYEDTEIILIDDLANGTEVETFKGEYGTLTVKAINPTELT